VHYIFAKKAAHEMLIKLTPDVYKIERVCVSVSVCVCVKEREIVSNRGDDRID